MGFDPASVVSVEDGYPAQEAGLQAGDTIERLNGTRTYLYRDVQTYLQFHPGKSATVGVCAGWEILHDADGSALF